MREKKARLLWFLAGLIYFILGFRSQNTILVILGCACITMTASEKDKKAKKRKQFQNLKDRM
jgi:hypothetical protein